MICFPHMPANLSSKCNARLALAHQKKGWPRLLGASPESPDVGIAIRYLSFSASIMGTAASQSIFQPIDTRTVSPVAGAVANSV